MHEIVIEVPVDLTKTAPAPVFETARIHVSADLSDPEPEILSVLDSELAEEEYAEAYEEPLPPVATTPVPERVIRLERLPEPHVAKPAPVPQETSPAAKRFVLSDILKPKTAPAPAEPVTEYSAPEEVVEAPLRPAPTPGPVSRRPPDFDRVAPIRPIPAGRNI